MRGVAVALVGAVAAVLFAWAATPPVVGLDRLPGVPYVTPSLTPGPVAGR